MTFHDISMTPLGTVWHCENHWWDHDGQLGAHATARENCHDRSSPAGKDRHLQVQETGAHDCSCL